MSSVTFSSAARDDLQQIFDYIRQRNPAAALAWLDRIEEKCLKLADSPYMGFPRDDLSPNLRCWPVSNYVIFYRTAADGIDVVRLCTAPAIQAACSESPASRPGWNPLPLPRQDGKQPPGAFEIPTSTRRLQWNFAPLPGTGKEPVQPGAASPATC